MTIPEYPHGKPKPRLSDRQRWELAGASLANAVALLDDAKTLLHAGRLQRAAFLFEACLEETLKGYLCLTREPMDDNSWRDFWETFRDHKLKLRLLKEIEPGSDAKHDAGNRTLRTWRERTVYVDVSEAGDPWTPMGLANPGGLSAEKVAGFQGPITRILGEQLERLKGLDPSMRRKGGT
ncbi:MAG: AbiV family abortive infection protein [Actinobacteria bacterium]|nr:AbiV family abortive infection protein [Actinomycetota bacterium]